VRHELQSAKVTPLITAELLLRHISNVPYNLSQMLRRHVRLLRLYEASTSLLSEALTLAAHPFLLLLLLLCQFRIDGRSSETRRRGWHTGRGKTWRCAWRRWGLPSWRRWWWKTGHDGIRRVSCCFSMSGRGGAGLFRIGRRACHDTRIPVWYSWTAW
jgi:hypothetical protein